MEDLKNIKPNWVSSKTWHVKDGEFTDEFYACDVEDRDLKLTVQIFAPTNESLNDYRDFILNALLNKSQHQSTEQDYVDHMIEEGKIK